MNTKKMPFKTPSNFLSFSCTSFKQPDNIDVYRLMAMDLSEIDAITSYGFKDFKRLRSVK